MGPNVITEKAGPSIWWKLYKQIANVLVIVLLVAAIVSGALQEWAEFGLILGVVAVNICISMVQESPFE